MDRARARQEYAQGSRECRSGSVWKGAKVLVQDCAFVLDQERGTGDERARAKRRGKHRNGEQETVGGVGMQGGWQEEAYSGFGQNFGGLRRPFVGLGGSGVPSTRQETRDRGMPQQGGHSCHTLHPPAHSWLFSGRYRPPCSTHRSSAVPSRQAASRHPATTNASLWRSSQKIKAASSACQLEPCRW